MDRGLDVVADGNGSQTPAEPTGGTGPPSGHALGAQNRRALLALGIISGILILLVLVGAIARAVS